MNERRNATGEYKAATGGRADCRSRQVVQSIIVFVARPPVRRFHGATTGRGFIPN